MNSTTQTDRPPWEIPIRERPPAPPDPERPRRGGGGRRLAALILLGVACLIATVAILGWMFDGGDDAAVDEPVATTTPITFAPRDDAPTSTAAEPTTTTEAPTTTTTEAPTTTTAPTTTAAPSTTAAPAPATGGTGSVPALTTSFGGGWVAQLTSVPYSAGTARLEAAYAEVRPFAPGARAARAEDWSSLNNGFWVLVEPGPFSSAQAARDFCASVDRSRSDCAARELRRS